jgi:hypothetical protein
MEVNINQAFPSKYFKADDLNPGETKTLIISQFTMENVGAEGKAETRPVLYFSNHEQGLVLNKTKAEILAEALGPETDAWPGHAIVIVKGSTTFQGRRVGCIDVHPAKQQQKTTFPTPPHVQGLVQRQQRQAPPPPPASYGDGPGEEYDPLG